jgi:hypothetical protein
MRGIVIPKGIDYIFQKNHSLFLFSLNFFFKKKEKRKPKPPFTVAGQPPIGGRPPTSFQKQKK